MRMMGENHNLALEDLNEGVPDRKTLGNGRVGSIRIVNRSDKNTAECTLNNGRIFHVDRVLALYLRPYRLVRQSDVSTVILFSCRQNGRTVRIDKVNQYESERTDYVHY